MAAYLEINNELKTTSVRFFTHDVDELKLKKFVISGLPCFDVSEIENSLKVQNVDFVNIQQVTVKQARFDNESIYIVSCKANTTNLGTLSKIKYVNHVSVKWTEHKNFKKGPTQCRNCFMYGHAVCATAICPKSALSVAQLLTPLILVMYKMINYVV